MQVNDRALPLLREELGITGMDELLEPETGIRAGVYILSYHLDGFGGDLNQALMAYQSGAAGARRKLAAGVESSAFSREVLRKIEELREGMEDKQWQTN